MTWLISCRVIQIDIRILVLKQDLKYALVSSTEICQAIYFFTHDQHGSLKVLNHLLCRLFWLEFVNRVLLKYELSGALLELSFRHFELFSAVHEIEI